MNRHKKEVREKELRRLQRELKKLWNSKGDVGGVYVPVDKPYQRGWFKAYALREDAKNRNDSDRMQKALALVNTTIYSRDKDFCVTFRGKRCPKPHELRKLTEKEYNNLPATLKKYFEPLGKSFYVLTNSFYYVTCIYPAMVESHWVPNPEYARKVAELQAQLGTEEWEKLRRLKGHRKAKDPIRFKSEAWQRDLGMEFFVSPEEMEECDEVL